jgi:stage III sporulation protein AD
MGIIQLVATGILCALLALTIKKQRPEIALVITLASGVLLFVMILPELALAVGIFTELGQMLEGSGQYISIVLRVIGVAYLAQLGTSLCADAGESTIAAKIDLGGRIIILVTALPIVVDIAGIVTGLLP